jgi:hypothetical protein
MGHETVDTKRWWQKNPWRFLITASFPLWMPPALVGALLLILVLMLWEEAVSLYNKLGGDE